VHDTALTSRAGFAKCDRQMVPRNLLLPAEATSATRGR